MAVSLESTRRSRITGADAAEARQLAYDLQRRARAAFAAHDLTDAAAAIAEAILMFPNERGLLDTFDDIVLQAVDPLALFPEASDSIATVAARARVAMMSQRLPEALGLLGRVLDVAPDLGHVDWARRWLAAPGIAAQMPWELLAGNVIGPSLRMVANVPVPPDAEDPRLGNVRAAAELFAQLLGVRPTESLLHMGLVMSLRRLGEPDKTLAAAHAGVSAFPQHWGLRIAAMNALADAGRPEEALEQARVALQLDPQDLSPLLDVARAYLAASRWSEASVLIDDLCARDPQFPGAQAYLHYTHFRQSGSAEAAQALLLLRDRRPDDEELERLASAIEPRAPYVNVLPHPPDLSATFAREVLRELAPIVMRCGPDARLELEIALRYPEAPSVRLAFEHEAARLGATHAHLRTSIELRPTPDPYADKGPVPLPVFHATSVDDVVPATPRADPSLAHAIGTLAHRPFRRDVWDPAARALAEHYGHAAAPAFTAVLHDPPPPPPDFDALIWHWRCQVATAIVLSHMGSWSSGPARGVIYSLVSGPSDWISSAGIVALSWRAHDDDTIREEVIGAFQWLRSIVPSACGATWQGALIDCWRALGRHALNELADLDAWRDDYERSLLTSNRVQAQRRYGGLTLEEYAWFVLERDRAHPAELPALCRRVGVDPARPFVREWHEALGVSRALHDAFEAVKRQQMQSGAALRTAQRPTGSNPSPM